MYAAPSIYQTDLCFVSLNVYKQYMGTHPCTLPGNGRRKKDIGIKIRSFGV